jgi:hypothetical protein
MLSRAYECILLVRQETKSVDHLQRCDAVCVCVCARARVRVCVCSFVYGNQRFGGKYSLHFQGTPHDYILTAVRTSL